MDALAARDAVALDRRSRARRAAARASSGLAVPRWRRCAGVAGAERLARGSTAPERGRSERAGGAGGSSCRRGARRLCRSRCAAGAFVRSRVERACTGRAAAHHDPCRRSRSRPAARGWPPACVRGWRRGARRSCASDRPPRASVSLLRGRIDIDIGHRARRARTSPRRAVERRLRPRSSPRRRRRPRASRCRWRRTGSSPTPGDSASARAVKRSTSSCTAGSSRSGRRGACWRRSWPASAGPTSSRASPDARRAMAMPTPPASSAAAAAAPASVEAPSLEPGADNRAATAAEGPDCARLTRAGDIDGALACFDARVGAARAGRRAGADGAGAHPARRQGRPGRRRARAGRAPAPLSARRARRRGGRRARRAAGAAGAAGRGAGRGGASAAAATRSSGARSASRSSAARPRRRARSTSTWRGPTENAAPRRSACVGSWRRDGAVDARAGGGPGVACWRSPAAGGASA